jgi:hypothetical protein
MRLSCVELAPLTRMYDLGGVGHSRRPVEALPKGVPNQCLWCCMVATSPLVYFPKQLPPLLGGNAMLQDSRGVAFVQFPA